MLGEEIATLVDGHESAGYNSVSFDASDFSSGVYFVRMRSGDYSHIKKII